MLWPSPSFPLPFTEFAKIITAFIFICQMENIKLPMSPSQNESKRDNVHEHLLKRAQVHQGSEYYEGNDGVPHFCIRGSA